MNRDDQERSQAAEGEVIALSPAYRTEGSADAGGLMRLKFARAYVETNGNAVEAARRAGYRGDLNSLKVIGCNLLKREDVKTYLGEILRAILSAEEASAILSDIIRSSLGNFLERDENGSLKKNEDGHYVIDLNSEAAQANLHTIKKLRHGKYGVEIELHNKVDALSILARGMQIKTSELIQKLQIQSVLEALPEEVRDSVKALIASAEAKRLNESNEFMEGEPSGY